RTVDGYVFRVDLRLRPDPSSTQIAVSIPAALDYYGSAGQNWERAAMIKARACAGDLAAGEAILKDLSPFIWRKYLDFVAVADLEAAYLFLRRTEHRLQMVADDQTHTLPSDRDGLEQFARFAGYKDRDAFAEELLGHMRKVQSHYSRLFEDASGRAPPLS